MYRYHRWWHGMEWPLGAAAVFLVVGVVMLIIVVTSASGVQWTGIRVHGQSQAGVVTYTYRGSEYTLTDDSHKTYATPHRVTVWLSRSHPEDSSKAFSPTASRAGRTCRSSSCGCSSPRGSSSVV